MKRYAIVGISTRAIASYIGPMVKQFGGWTQIVAMLDRDPLRFKIAHDTVPGLPNVPTFAPEQFELMLDQTKPDAVIVLTSDDLHAPYAIAALQRNLDVIVEKPMTIDCQQAQAVLAAEARSKGKVTVTHNMRYTPAHQKLKQLLHEGRIGRVTHVDFNYYVDTRHGASYMKRWNRQRDRSGGLTIHKGTHHFDLVNWLIDQDPQQVFAYSALNYFGAGAPKNPSRKDGRTCSTCAEREQCAYEMRWSPDRTAGGSLGKFDEQHIAGIKAKQYSEYVPDRCIFDSDIDIEDTYVATVRYAGGAMMSYSDNFSTPYEGYRLAINGTEGRLEHETCNPRGTFVAPPAHIIYYPLFNGAREIIEPLQRAGGHGGGDTVLLEELFLGPDTRIPWSSVGTSRAGALAVAVGEAVWRSGKENRPYNISELLTLDQPAAAHPLAKVP